MILIKVFTCPNCGIKYPDINKLPVHCGTCGFIDHTMDNIHIEETTNGNIKTNNDKVRAVRAVRGYGIPRPYIPPQPPKKSEDLPESVREWLQEGLEQ